MSQLVAVSMMLGIAGPALAQDTSWAVGTWKGRVEGSREQDPNRVMTIAIAGGIAKCGWGEGFRANPPPAKSCTVSATGMTLTTGANNQVELRRSGSTLSGTFTATSGGGRTYNLTMKKE
ncbi:hypothetical protein [Vineibacter terrae]|uniref:hypothetical protein n=1 Tax=Vineibacter terrae TaxID=2586908 RepID=UPI002E32F5BF|nr:hypothetical protein [Vineibacter terrae]HEX2886053.1 hypothetical protein [Vineibacter terrae]